jgi:hypothetical protein
LIHSKESEAAARRNFSIIEISKSVSFSPLFSFQISIQQFNDSFIHSHRRIIISIDDNDRVSVLECAAPHIFN